MLSFRRSDPSKGKTRNFSTGKPTYFTRVIPPPGLRSLCSDKAQAMDSAASSPQLVRQNRAVPNRDTVRSIELRPATLNQYLVATPLSGFGHNKLHPPGATRAGESAVEIPLESRRSKCAIACKQALKMWRFIQEHRSGSSQGY